MNTSHPLLVRKLLVDLSQGFPRHWLAGGAFRTQFFNAMSMSFPVGEQDFIDSVREAALALPDDAEHASLHATIRDFVGQEATHRRVHTLYNTELEKQGLVNHWQHWAAKLIALGRERNMPAISRLAVTAAFEHYTAVLADLTLRNPEIMGDADPMLRTLWTWHAVEETEHKAVAFDLYLTLGGSYKTRVRWYMFAMTRFTIMATRQTVNNLWHDRTLFKPSTWLDAASFFFGSHGLFWLSFMPLLGYLKRDFHPWQHDNRALAEQWLRANADRYSIVRGLKAA
ncbi:metal-dependent hydrolase [Collimonas arenae]|uniref:metal-dependent hydrolase n=1 Tax=Collimonas arenae TaxID=279058 RepID=UPI00056DC374|nr:metal-dependent hydrolase [Collimonas arenae]